MTQTAQVKGVNTKLCSNNGDMIVTYHNTQVVIWNDKEITLNHGGYMTSTTKRRMNQASNQFELGYYVYQRNYKWFCDYQGETYCFDHSGILILERV